MRGWNDLIPEEKKIIWKYTEDYLFDLGNCTQNSIGISCAITNLSMAFIQHFIQLQK
jgi:hypothetical protein